MNNLLLVLSVLTFVGLGPALAQGDVAFETSGMEGDLLATELVGADLFATDTAVDQNRFQIDAVPDDWEQVASIGDVVLGSDGQVRGVLVDVGGFLGVGARTVMLSMDSVSIATHADGSAVVAVIHATREDLEAAPEFVPFDGTGQISMDDEAAQARVGVAEPQEGFATIAWSTLTVDELRGAAVYDVDNERVADITDVLLGTDDTVEAVLIDVGGFLGIGGRTVAINMDQLEIQGNQDASDFRVYLAVTEEQLESLPEHDAN